MNPTTEAEGTEVGATVTVQNVGGIDETEVDLDRGVNVLEGRNATNRTSFLRSIMAAMGSDNVTLKGGAHEGYVELAIGDETYTRTFERDGDEVVTGGDPYLDDPTVADLFAFLLEDNQARRSVARSEDLRDIIMQPVDTDEIEHQIREAEQEKSRLDDRLSEFRSRKQRLPDLEQERTELEDKLAEKRDELADVRDHLDSLDSDVDESREQREELEERLGTLNEIRNELEEARNRLDSEHEQLEALKSERTDLREERDELPTSIQEISDVGQRIGELQERKRTLDSLLDRLQNIIQFNREVVEDADSELREALVPDDGHTTDQLLGDERNLVCWTCGSNIEREDIEQTLDDLQEVRQEKMDERKEVSAELDELRERKQEMEKSQQRREQLEHQLERIDDRIDRHEERIQELRAERDRLTDRVEELEAAVEEVERDEDDERVLELNKRANKLELTIADLESDLESAEEEIDSLEADIERIDELESERESVQRRLSDLRTRIESLERDAVEAFNEHMAEVLDRLNYDNIDRIWIERREAEVREGRQKVTKSAFDLHVVRTTGDGSAYEDTIEHLSESEREVTGLVFALSGYLVHDVYETVPFMLLDSLEAIDAERIADLVDYFQTYAPFLVVALLKEDAQALEENAPRITDI